MLSYFQSLSLIQLAFHHWWSAATIIFLILWLGSRLWLFLLNRKGKLDAQREHKAQLKTWSTQHHLSERDVSVIRIV